jgi:hypothetical protein
VCDARRSDLGNGAGPALSTREHNRGVDVGLREPGELGCEMIDAGRSAAEAGSGADRRGSPAEKPGVAITGGADHFREQA